MIYIFSFQFSIVLAIIFFLELSLGIFVFVFQDKVSFVFYLRGREGDLKITIFIHFVSLFYSREQLLSTSRHACNIVGATKFFKMITVEIGSLTEDQFVCWISGWRYCKEENRWNHWELQGQCGSTEFYWWNSTRGFCDFDPIFILTSNM